MPLEVVRAAAAAMELPAGARILEIGAGCGQLTRTLVDVGFDVVALEPGDALRARAAERAPAARFVPATFEEYEPDGRFDAIFSSNAFHWVDPEVGYPKAAELAGALVLIWNTPFIAEPELRRRVQDGVMVPHGSTFPTEEADVRQHVADEIEAMRGRIRDHGRGSFEEPWTQVHERVLRCTPDRFRDLIGSMGKVAASPDRDVILAELEPVLGNDPLDVIDLVWVLAARSA
jgi:protein-L-isoaspartate O-methyltransferase